jgi:hypothetical protein
LGVSLDDHVINNEEHQDIDNQKSLDLRHLEILSDRDDNGRLFLNPSKANYFPEKVESIRFALRIMENSYIKSPHFNCFGEWGCVYMASLHLYVILNIFMHLYHVCITIIDTCLKVSQISSLYLFFVLCIIPASIIYT